MRAPGGGVRHAVAYPAAQPRRRSRQDGSNERVGRGAIKSGQLSIRKSGMFFAAHCDPHDSSPPLGLGCQSPQRWKYPTHRSKSWEELAKRRASQRRPSHQARRKSKAGENSLRAGWALLFFCPQPHGCCAAHRHSVTVQGRYFPARRTSLSSLGLRRPKPGERRAIFQTPEIAMAKVAQIEET